MKHIILGAILTIAPSLAYSNCGGDFPTFVNGLKQELQSKGASPAEADRFFSNAAIDGEVLKLDRSQFVFRQNFNKFASRAVSQDRLVNGAKNWKIYSTSFERAEREFGVPAPVLLAFWAMETDFGVVRGKFNTLNALITLSHDCRRPDLFRPQIFATFELWKRNEFDPITAEGAWAGEIGMVQMLPLDVLQKGVDGDGDGRVDLDNSAPDAILTSAKVLQSHGWQRGQPWLVEVSVPQKMNWQETGLNKPQRLSEWFNKGVTAKRNTSLNGDAFASLILPEGKDGPAFLAFDNFNVYFEWNRSLVNVTSAAYFATRFAGEPAFDAGNPTPPLSDDDMIALQKKLSQLGHDVGKIDGILGAKTRAAVQKEQSRYGLPADAWPTIELLKKL